MNYLDYIKDFMDAPINRRTATYQEYDRAMEEWKKDKTQNKPNIELRWGFGGSAMLELVYETDQECLARLKTQRELEQIRSAARKNDTK